MVSKPEKTPNFAAAWLVLTRNPNSSTQRVPAGATASEVNAAEDARIGDFRYRFGKTRIGTSSTWAYLGRDAEGGVLSKGSSQDERGGATVGGMRRRILRMRFSAPQSDNKRADQHLEVRLEEPRVDADYLRTGDGSLAHGRPEREGNLLCKWQILRIPHLL